MRLVLGFLFLFCSQAFAANLAITSPAAGTVITADSAKNFQISGTCNFLNSQVTISGAASAVLTCDSSSNWKGVFDVSALPDGNVTFTASSFLSTAVSRVFLKSADALAGEIQSVVFDSTGSGTVSGWACQVGSLTSVKVNLSLFKGLDAGATLQTVTANLPSSASATSACSTAGANYGFKFSLPSSMNFKFGGAKIFATASTLNNAKKLDLVRSGSYKVSDFNPVKTAVPRICVAKDIATLKQCNAAFANYDEISFSNDISCSTIADCCGSGNSAMLRMNTTSGSNRILNGNGYALKRYAGQNVCSVLQVYGSQNVLVKNLSLDEGETTAFCTPYDSACPSVVQVSTAQNVRFDNFKSYYARKTALGFSTVDGVSISNSILAENGVFASYIGGGAGKHSKNIAVWNSQVVRARTNGLVLQGADGETEPIWIYGNLFTQNHYNGLYDDGKGGVYNGGQVYMPTATNVVFKNNVVADGYCAICNNTAVWSIELGGYGDAESDAPVGIVYDQNYFYNSYGVMVMKNGGVKAKQITISSNLASGLGYSNYVWELPNTNATGATFVNNVSADKVPSLNQKGIASYAIYRTTSGVHFWEGKLSKEGTSTYNNLSFKLSRSPRSGAPSAALYRCLNKADLTDDYISLDRDCENNGVLHSVAGYSLEPSYPGASKLYRCYRVNQGKVDHFVSGDSSCEGATVETVLGYAIKGI